MTKSQLIKKLCDIRPNILHKDMEKIMDIILLEIADALSRGESIQIRNFGTYKIKERKARIGRNPKNSEIVQIPAKKAIKWKMSKSMYARLNNNFTESKISDTY